MRDGVVVVLVLAALVAMGDVSWTSMRGGEQNRCRGSVTTSKNLWRSQSKNGIPNIIARESIIME